MRLFPLVSILSVLLFHAGCKPEAAEEPVRTGSDAGSPPSRTDRGDTAAAPPTPERAPEPAPAPEAPAPEAAPPAPTIQRAPEAPESPELKKLRAGCYGGRKQPLTDMVMEYQLGRALRGMRQRDATTSRNAYRKMLQGGANEVTYIPPFIKALEATGEKEDAAAAKACGDLVRKLP